MKPYSEDLRWRVVSAVASGMPRADVAWRFAVSVPTITRWLRLKRQTGGLAPTPVPGPPAVKMIALLAALPERVAEHADATLEEHCSWWRDVSGVEVSTATMSRALTRLGQKAAPTYEQLRIAVRRSPLDWMDETGWRVAAYLQWLWVVVSPEVTVYDILPGRGFAEAASILGEDYDGALHHDGWRPYYRFLKALHQSCLSHLIHRCHDIIQVASPTARRFPQAILQLFRKALVLRDRFRDGEISLHGLYVATGRIGASMDRLLDKSFRSKLNRRFAKHLHHERPYLFSFLYCPDLDATNNAAEQAIRPAVIARKTWGGNRTASGAKTQKILASILRTCWQQRKDSFSSLTKLMRSPQQMI